MIAMMVQTHNKCQVDINNSLIKQPPSKSVVLGVLEKFHRTGSVLCQRNGSRKIVCTNENAKLVLHQHQRIIIFKLDNL